MKRSTMLTDFLDHARWGAVGGLALVTMGAVLEGISVLLLIPVISTLLGDKAATGLAHILPQGASLGGIVGVFGVVLLVRFAVLHWRDRVLTRLEQGFVAATRLRLFRALAIAPWTRAARLDRGRIGHALSRDIDRAALSIGAVLRGASAGLLLVVQGCIALWLSPVLSLLAGTLGGIAFLALGRVRRRAHQQGEQMTRDDFALTLSASGFLRGLKAAKAHGLEARYLDSFSRAAQRFADQHLVFRRDSSLASLGVQTLAGALALLTILVGHSWLAIEPAVLIVILVLMVRLSGPLQVIQQSMQTLRHGQAAYDAAMTEVDGGDMIEPLAGPSEPWPHPPTLVMDRIHWTPDDAAPVLSAFSATFPAGEVTVLRGPSGAGKTTICDMLAGVLDPDAGQVLIDGVTRDNTTRRRVQASLSYVGQEAFLWDTTVREALNWGSASASDAALWRVLSITGADTIVRALPGGLDAALRADGSQLSGGERQRLHLARALLRKPRLILMDEATNALDLEAEEHVLRKVMEAREGATVVMISHRADAVRFADHVVDVTPAHTAP